MVIMAADIATAPSLDFDERALTAAELKAAEDKLQSLCATHAATFVAVERRGGTLTKSLKDLLQVLDAALPRVEESKKCLEVDTTNNDGESGGKGKGEIDGDGCSETLSTLAERHRLRRRTLLQHSSLLELLELPSLMDACVRGHLYEEGLSIASFANTLERRHLISSSTSSDHNEKNNHDVKNRNPIVENVVFEVRKREGDLRRDLLNRLRSDVTMPQCLEIVTALRRLNGVELERLSRDATGTATGTGTSSDLEKVHENMEWRLQVNFLEARDVWLEGNTSVNNTGLAFPSKGTKSASMMKANSEKILDGIDVYRTRCFEIATQFLAIFRSSSASSTPNNDHAYQMLSMWTTRRIHTFLQDHLATKCLPLISDTATLRDALESVTFFATSMGRVGADFSPMIPPIFEPILVTIVTSHWSDGVNVFENTLKVCRDTGIASPLHSSREVSEPLREHDAASGGGGLAEDVDFAQRSKTPAPPRQLLALPPLARLVNSFLMGLNELRRCLLTSAFPKLRVYFKDEFVKKVMSVLLQNERAVLTPGFLNMKGEDAGKLRSVAIELKEEFEGCVEPYLTGALEVALGSFESITKSEAYIEQQEYTDDVEDLSVDVTEENENEGEVDALEASEGADEGTPLTEEPKSEDEENGGQGEDTNSGGDDEEEQAGEDEVTNE